MNRPDRRMRALASKAYERLREDLLGLRFAANVFIGTVIVWGVLSLVARAKPIWAISSMIASSEPMVTQALSMFRCRLINTAVGCAAGLLFVGAGDPTPWKLPFALAITVLVSTYIVQVRVMWRQAPITAAIVIAGSLSAGSARSGVELGLMRVAEVLFGCIVGVTVSWLMARVWPIEDPPPKPGS
jgi:uncharacterized membrane protein YccC